MINLDLLKTKSGLEQKVAELKLWLVQKEDVEYTNFIQNPENATQVKSAKDKIVSQLKLQDEECLNINRGVCLSIEGIDGARQEF
jgi:hypothetical protein